MNYFIKQFQNPNGFIGRLLGKTMSWFNRKMHKSVLSAIDKFSTLLGIGYGSGTQLEMIKKHFPDSYLYGIDISQDMYTMASQRLGNAANLFLCDCEKTSFQDSFFDIVVTTDTCYFWESPLKVLDEIKRILKPDGQLIIAYNSMYARSVHASKPQNSMYDDESILKAFDSCGFTVISTKKCGFKQKVFVTNNGEC